MRKHLYFATVLAVCTSANADVGYEPGPLIGVVSVPSTKSGKDYIPKSYVDWVHSAGGRVMPLPSGVRWNTSLANWTVDPFAAWTSEQFKAAFEMMNGLLLPGGNPWPIVSSPSVRQLLELARDAHNAGDYFPIWGTCAGFETLVVLSSNGTCQSKIVDGQVPAETCDGPMTYGWNSTNVSLPQQLADGSQNSRLIFSMGEDLLLAMQTKPIAANFHRAAAAISTFAASPQLTKTFRVLSKSSDADGEEFVSLIEGVDLPWYGAQWHPEKPAGEWGIKNGVLYEAINHGPDAIRLGQHMANFLISEASKNSHGRGQLAEVTPLTIINHSPRAYDPKHPLFVQLYNFNWSEAASPLRVGKNLPAGDVVV